MNYSDPEIIQAIITGNDRDALNYLYKKVFPKVRKFIKYNSGDSDSAFDIFQDSIMVFYKYVKTNKFDKNSEISGFIFSVSKNAWINKAIRDKRIKAIPEYYDCPDAGINILEGIMDKEREKEVARLLSMLGERCGELLKYTYFHKLKNIEICRKMGFGSENAVKTRKYKCMQKLLSLVENNPEIKQTLSEI